jgi:hypothetical protein
MPPVPLAAVDVSPVGVVPGAPAPVAPIPLTVTLPAVTLMLAVFISEASFFTSARLEPGALTTFSAGVMTLANPSNMPMPPLSISDFHSASMPISSIFSPSFSRVAERFGRALAMCEVFNEALGHVLASAFEFLRLVFGLLFGLGERCGFLRGLRIGVSELGNAADGFVV